MLYKRIIIILIVALVLVGIISLEFIIPRQVLVSKLITYKADVLYVLKSKDWKTINNPIIINKFNELIFNKQATRIGNVKCALDIEYGYKGKAMTITPEGEIIIAISKSEIRNKSRLHWLWWKINSLYDRSGTIKYKTEPDPKMIELGKIIRE